MCPSTPNRGCQPDDPSVRDTSRRHDHEWISALTQSVVTASAEDRIVSSSSPVMSDESVRIAPLVRGGLMCRLTGTASWTVKELLEPYGQAETQNRRQSS